MNVRAIVLSGAAIAATVLLVAATVFLLLHWWDVPPDTGRAPVDHPLAGGRAGLQSAPQQDLAAYRAEKERRLHGIGWVDAQRGIAHIPIEDAMAALAAGAAR
jgi:hypothetical protein